MDGGSRGMRGSSLSLSLLLSNDLPLEVVSQEEVLEALLGIQWVILGKTRNLR